MIQVDTTSNSFKNAESQHTKATVFYVRQVIMFYDRLIDLLLNEKFTDDDIRVAYDECLLYGGTKNSLINYFLKEEGNKDKKNKQNSNAKKPKRDKDYYFTRFLKKELKQSFNDKTFLEQLQNLLNRLSENYKGVPIFEFLLVNKPEKIENASKEINNIYFTSKTKSFINQIFDYSKLYNGISGKENNEAIKWNSYDLTKSLGIDTCLYCNRNSILTVRSDTNKKVIRPDLDHFFEQKRHPFLALSFYNLIPSCSTCNSRLKGSKEFTLKEFLHPYLDGFGDDAVFRVMDKEFETLYAIENDYGLHSKYDIKIKVKNSNIKNRINQNIKQFRLNEIYSNYESLVGELNLKRHRYNHRYLEIISKSYKDSNNKDGIKLSIQDAYRIAFGNYYDDSNFHKRPLAKFTSDLVKQFKLMPKETLEKLKE